VFVTQARQQFDSATVHQFYVRLVKMLGHHDAGLETLRCGFESRNAHRLYRFRIMDNTAGFYPANMGSIPVGGATIKVEY